MKYTLIKFSEISGKLQCYETDSLNSYTKNKMYNSVYWMMYVDTDKLEIGKEKFKKELLKHYNNLINKIENDLRTN